MMDARMARDGSTRRVRRPGRGAWTLLAPALLALLLAAPHAGAQVGIPVGAKAPGAVVETLDGRRVDLAQYIGQRPVLIEFWATWCPTCEELEPRVRAVAARYGDRVRILGVAVGVNQTPARVKRFAERHRLPMEILFDRTGAAVEAYSVPATSYVVVIDRAGKVVYTGQGGEQDLEAAVGRAMR